MRAHTENRDVFEDVLGAADRFEIVDERFRSTKDLFLSSDLPRETSDLLRLSPDRGIFHTYTMNENDVLLRWIWCDQS